MNLSDIQSAVADTVKQVLKQEKNCKTEDGTCYPASDFAVVPDRSKPSTWKLRLSQGSPGNITKSQLGRAAAAFSEGGFRGNRVQLSADEARKAKARIRREYRKLDVDTEEIPDSVKEQEPHSFIWKGDDGQYRWLAAYTNNYRDNDNPPEIISSDAHKEFDKAVNSGEWPMPEVWLWHYPYPVGKTHTHVYDEKSGFCIAGGTFDKDKAWAAEGIIERGWQGISHGMPKQYVKRDEKDKSIITSRRTREITFLPTQRAANDLAFHIISKENDIMSDEHKEIPAHKREEFIAAFGEERVTEMEDEIAKRSEQAKENGTESKEQSQEQEQQKSEPPADVVEAIQALTTAVSQMSETVKSLDDRVKELEEDDSNRLAEKAAAIPEASLAAFVKSQLFTKDNTVKEKGPGPEQTENERDGTSGLFFEEMGWTQPLGGQ